MTENKTSGVRKLATRLLAAGALLAIYTFSTAAVTGVMTVATDTSAYAGRRGRGRGRGRGAGRGRGRGRGGGRGRGRGRGRWWGGVWVPGCHAPWNSRWAWRYC
jgi:hypothetical protein